MNIANLPVASPFNLTPVEPKLRTAEFKLLDAALKIGNISDALKLVGILQLNAPNLAQAIQKQRQFGYDNLAAQDLEILANALKGGDLPAAQNAYDSFKIRVEPRIVHRRSEDDSSETPSQDSKEEDSNENSGNDDSPLDVLA
jgi:hypothetical protein